MQVSIEWLNEFVDIKEIPPAEIAHELTMSGLEVEEVEKIGADFTNIVVGEILAIKSHPDADKLHLVEIYNGIEKKEVVCGAQNIAAGQLIPYASIGSEVKDRKTGEKFTLKPVKIRGVESQGMLCSAEELGLKTSDFQQEDGILILNKIDNIKVGQDVKEALNIKEDYILHVAPTANRGDEMSVIGISREIAAIYNKKLKYSELQNKDIEEISNFKIELIDEECCKYYALGLVKNVKIKPSPDWMQRRLTASGVRVISNVVDITNYVMLEYGQPLHAFDFDKLSQVPNPSKSQDEMGYISVRKAKEGEKITTLDEIERSLSQDSVLIATKKEPVALAGLMGGFSSEIDSNTRNIALESAYFTPCTNRRSSRSVGLRTEACARFERGVDIKTVRPALIRALQLLVQYADAEVCGISETGDNKLPDIEIVLRFAQIKRILGIQIPDHKCLEILENLGFELLGRNDFSAKFLVPSYRTNDVTREIDIIEEISRIHGYDKIEPTLPRKTQSPEISEETRTLNKIHKIFTGNGFNEAVSSSLIGEPLLEWAGMKYNKEQAVKVVNPQSDDYTMLRQSLIPSIIHLVKYNFDQGQKNVWLYETGKTFFFTGVSDNKNTGVEEKRILAGAISGNITSGKWHANENVDFYTLKGIIERLFKELNIENRVEYLPVSGINYLHPGRSAEIKLQAKGQVILGRFGEIHPDTQEKCKLSQPVYLFELDIDALLLNSGANITKYKPLPLYPAVIRDIAFIISENISHSEIAKVIKKSASNLFKGAEIFDVYQGEHVKKGLKSLAYRVTLQDLETTLTDERTDAEILKIKEGLKKAFPEINFRE